MAVDTARGGSLHPHVLCRKSGEISAIVEVVVLLVTLVTLVASIWLSCYLAQRLMVVAGFGADFDAV